MKDSPEHTFVILAYQESKYLEECIRSLLRQTVKSRILLSTSTPSVFLDEVSKKYNIPLFVNKERDGIACDWSFAYKSSKTKYVTLAHQDDLYFPKYTKECLLSADRIRSSLLTFTDYGEIINDRLRYHSILLAVKRLILFLFLSSKKKTSSPARTKLMLSFGNPVCCPTIMYNKENIGPFEFDRSFTMNLDWEAAFRLAKMKGDFIYINKKLLARRIHRESESTNALENKKRRFEDEILFNRLWQKPIAKFLLRVYSIGYKFNG